MIRQQGGDIDYEVVYSDTTSIIQMYYLNFLKAWGGLEEICVSGEVEKDWIEWIGAWGAVQERK